MLFRWREEIEQLQEELAEREAEVQALQIELERVRRERARLAHERDRLAARVRELEALLEEAQASSYPPFPVGRLLDRIARWLTDRPKPSVVETSAGEVYASVRVEGELLEEWGDSKRAVRERIWRRWLSRLLEGSGLREVYEDA